MYFLYTYTCKFLYIHIYIYINTYVCPLSLWLFAGLLLVGVPVLWFLWLSVSGVAFGGRWFTDAQWEFGIEVEIQDVRDG